MPSFKDWLFGSEDKLKKVETGTKDQTGLHNDILGQLKSMLQPGGGFSNANDYFNNLLNPESGSYDEFSQPYLQQFQEQVIPQIAERFGGMGALSSSGFAQALGGAGAGLQSQLAQLFSSLQGGAAQQQYGQFNQMSNQGLNHNQFAYQNQKGSAGMLGPLLTGAASAIGGPLAGAGMQGIQSLFKKDAQPASGGLSSGGGMNQQVLQALGLV